MSYVGSYNWKLRQKIGSDLIINVSVDILVLNQEEKVCLVKPFDYDKWTIIGGYVEIGDSYKTAAMRELLEEAGISTTKNDLELFSTLSGGKNICHYQDGKVQPFTLSFLAKKWSYNDSQRDDEIERIDWFEIKHVLESDKVDDYTKKIIRAYQNYQKTNKVQMIEEF